MSSRWHPDTVNRFPLSFEKPVGADRVACNRILVSTRSARPHRWSGDSSTKSSEQTAETLETLDDMSYDKLRQGTWAFEHSQINSSTSEAKGTSSTSLLKRALHFRLRRAPEPVEEKKDQPTPRLLVPDLVSPFRPGIYLEGTILQQGRALLTDTHG